MSKQLILIGAGGHARACIDVIETEKKYSIAGLVGRAEEVNDRIFMYKVLGTDSSLLPLAHEFKYGFIGVGQLKTPKLRIHLFEQGLAAGFVFPTIISPQAYVSPHAKIGEGTIVMHGAIVNAGASVGKNCIINSNALIEHDSIIGDNTHISTGAIINGGAEVGNGCFVGSRSVVSNCVSIGRNSFIGLGAKVKLSLENESKFM
jgi:sugar O-acyltransferase (sialic acid O-acetyltransferase NeuD family)